MSAENGVLRPPGAGRRFAVAGMGATGVGVFVALVRSLAAGGHTAGAEVHIFETKERLGAGVAYSTPHDCHLLNMRAATMSVRAEDPDHFVHWLAERNALGPAGAGEYVPRRLFAEYLQEFFDEALAEARQRGIKVVTHKSVVSDCREDALGVHLIAGLDHFVFGHVFLCLGDLPSTEYLEFTKLPTYVHSMWQGAGLEAIDPDATVGILGTSLTAVDALLQLRAAGHRGPVTCFSRRRSLPKVQGPRVRHTLRHVTEDNLRRLTGDFTRQLEFAEVAELFRRELEDGLGLAIDWKRVLARPADPVTHTLAKDVELAENGQTLWYSILDATSEIVPLVWRSMSPGARASFMTEHLSIWSMFRHCMPLDNARRLLDMATDGAFAVASELTSVTYDEEDAAFRMEAGGAAHRVEWLVNATGTGFALDCSDSSLIQNMLMRGDITPHPLGGIDVDFDTLRVVRRDGSLSERAHYIGPLTRGVHFYTNSFETNLANAHSAVAAVLTRLDSAAAA
ncbi:FAD/NAD(P)-binding protein [Streptomyces fulvoviolaceus]|uniref:FAD/NAD(P)-binding protein n=1 Tax=Streptomyces fulvoviolaceus TaxID=285535 RepID=UPI0005B8CBFC|nr:FAD/NAD(P)-binding protein [Streptomyces fulvoviolaceus]MCT9081059.1 FAD/NAD(P)-binding protein [Streptomyces fulvoviolaceus]